MFARRFCSPARGADRALRRRARGSGSRTGPAGAPAVVLVSSSSANVPLADPRDRAAGPIALLYPPGELVHPAATVFTDVPFTFSAGQSKSFWFSLPFTLAVRPGSDAFVFPHPTDAGAAARLDVVAVDPSFPALHTLPPLLASLQPGALTLPGGVDLPLAADPVFTSSATSGLFGLLTNHAGPMGLGPAPPAAARRCRSRRPASRSRAA